MLNFKEISSCYYLDREHTILDRNKLTELRDRLKTTEQYELISLDDHKEYLSLLSKFRKAIAETASLNGENFNKTLSSLLSVGADGVYTNDLRFIFELIQNVDDCDFIDPQDCELDMQFNFNEGTITLKYNEVGFSPFNVFSITGIAEAAKNISPEKIEIGEKGIGFKSVFGVADKVWIQSGKFSFILNEENFTVPEIKYDSFSGIEGTKLVLFIKPEVCNTTDYISNLKSRGIACRKIYKKIIEKYCTKDALFNNNPILFLKQLTKIRLFVDGFDSLEFVVSKGLDKKLISSEIYCEENVAISSIVSSRDKNITKKETTILCTRYTMPVKYSRDMCISRYGLKTAFPYKDMKIQLIVPNAEFIAEVDNGSLYSFLPTQIKTTVPISCHIPFKLNSSREYVDDQDGNLWFVYSCNTFAKMLGAVYLDLAQKVKTSILSYLPTSKNYFFENDGNNDKISCLMYSDFSATKILELPIFYTVDNHYKNCNEIFCFSRAETIKDPLAIYSLMNYNKELFVPTQPNDYDVSKYGIEIFKKVYIKLFRSALNHPSLINTVLNILDTAEIKYSSLLEEVDKTWGEIKIPFEAIAELSKFPKCFKAFNALTISKIKENKTPTFLVKNIGSFSDIKYIISEDEPVDVFSFDVVVNKYLASQNYKYCKADLCGNHSYFIGKNALVLSKVDTLDSFATFTRDLGKNDYFAANMTMRSASLKLNDAENMLSVSDYMKLLREVREAIKSAFGKKQYDSYIKVIRELNSDPMRFIRELLQNADDCKYDEGKIPCFKLTVADGIIKTECNEKGFTKENARAITAIGESTKKQIYSGNLEIGEKGIGFKTVFSVADEVEIHSNEFHFSLEYDTPTIPKILSSLDSSFDGTVMLFKLKENIKVFFTKEEVLSLCLCLRNLKDIVIGNISVHIDDIDGQRIITISNEKYVFDVYSYEFIVSNPTILKERSDGDKCIQNNQRITYYLSTKDIPKFKYYLYEGLPTTIEFGVPLVIDAPFELTASRDNVLYNNWNKFILSKMYDGYIGLLEKLAPKYRIDILRYIRFVSLQFGSQIKFSLFKNISDSWLDSAIEVVNQLRLSRIIPTYENNYFTIAKDTTVCRYPSVIHELLSLVGTIPFAKHIIEDKNNNYDSTLKNLGCREVEFSRIVDILGRYDTIWVKDEKLLKSTYEYLEEMAKRGINNFNLRNVKLIPIKGSADSPETQFVSYNSYKEEIFVDDNAICSPSDYKVLDTEILPRYMLEKILDVEIQVMDSVYKKYKYSEKIERIILSDESNQQKYRSLMYELIHHREQLKEADAILFKYQEQIPFLMENNTYATGNVFIVAAEHRVFNSEILNSHIVSQEATPLAKLINIPNISDISYDDLDIYSEINEDDILDFQLPYIKNGFQILNQCMFNGFISDALIERYGLIGFKPLDYACEFDESDFPSEPVKNPVAIRNAITKGVETVRKIIEAQRVRTVHMIRQPNGTEISIDSKEIRENTMRRYRPALNTDGCFCQMCRTVKSSEYIETNNIFTKPEYYWPQTRIALCLDCSKKFTLIRSGNELAMKKFYECIETADITSADAISIPIGDADVRFTQTHLAELQEIIKSGKK